MKPAYAILASAALFSVITLGADADDGNHQAAVPCVVCSVNSATGAVTVPTVQRQSSAALDASAGTVNWTFPTTFTHSPTCYSSLASASTTYTFDVPLVTSISTTSVSLKLTAHPTSVTITALTLPIVLSLTANPPSGTTVTLTCVGALP